MNIIRKLTIYFYLKSLKEMISFFNYLSKDKVAEMLVYSVWLRAMLEIEGNCHVVLDEHGNIIPELNSYPLQLISFEEYISFLNKNGHGSKAYVLSIWVHSLRSILHPEMHAQIKQLWNILVDSKPHWGIKLNAQVEEDLRIGIPKDLVVKTELHSKAILDSIPPKQFY